MCGCTTRTAGPTCNSGAGSRRRRAGVAGRRGVAGRAEGPPRGAEGGGPAPRLGAVMYGPSLVASPSKLLKGVRTAPEDDDQGRKQEGGRILLYY
mmetsp:Transcript_15087/g.23744  ORF Transcript_15087/g.23744 Transcript_15087/m.23744 type:complete len:95 (-) Transcript_15087:417-701(-)